MRFRLIIAAAWILFSLACTASAADPTVAEMHLSLIGADRPALQRALMLLQQIIAEEGEGAEILCLLAEAHFYYGDWFSGEEQMQIWRQGERYARRALEQDPLSADAHYWVAATLGKIGRAQGILRSLFLVNPMLEHLSAALEIDEEHSWAYYALSHLYMELPPKPLGRGDRTLALSYASRAFELEPGEPEFVVQYAKLLLRANQEHEARSLLLDALDDATVRWTEPLYSEAKSLAQLRGSTD